MLRKVLGFGLVFVLFCLPVFAQEEGTDSITITTYYPSPYGSYNQLQVYRGVTYMPLDSLPTDDLREGEMVYLDSDLSDSTPGQYYYYGAGSWVQQAGGCCVYFLACSCPRGSTTIALVGPGVLINGGLSISWSVRGIEDDSWVNVQSKGITLGTDAAVVCCQSTKGSPQDCVRVCKYE